MTESNTVDSDNDALMLAQDDNPTDINQTNDMMNYDDDDDTKHNLLAAMTIKTAILRNTNLFWQWPENDGTGMITMQQLNSY